MTNGFFGGRDPLAVLRGMEPQQFREALARHAGATPEQLSMLRSVEKDLDCSFPSYEACPGGVIRATYTDLSGVLHTVTVLPDGTLVE
ncbi:hypothetical protein FHR86_003784 [Paenarthrobacter ilicis]|uniref:Uncharacterized protein n=1 Tax=Paenarthrobacter ilicis TaxID=43665 RepID=A0ABX0TNK9_9MICC|nr:hypothetical protein [Paenarthrobacter ilicis]